MQPISAPARSMFGTTPEVDSVMRRLEMPRPSPSDTISSASRTASRLYSGSPMPIMTMLVTQRSPVGMTPSVGRVPPGQSPMTIARRHNLPGNFAGGEIAHQTLRAGVTERTGQRAADLARDAQSATLGVGDVNALDVMGQLRLVRIARQPHQPFAGAVDGDLFHATDFWPRHV